MNLSSSSCLRLTFSLMLLVGAGLAVCPAQAQQNISVKNFSFEGPVAPAQGGGFFYSFNTITDWVGNANDAFGVFDPVKSNSTAFYSNGSVPDGNQVAYVNVGTIYQNVDADFVAGDTYTLSVFFGQRKDLMGSGSVSFYSSDGIKLATSPVLTSSPGTFTKYSFAYTAAKNDQGKGIQIHLNQANTGGSVQANFDGIVLTTSAAPVPKSSTTVSLGLLLMLGLGGMAVAAKRRKSAAA